MSDAAAGKTVRRIATLAVAAGLAGAVLVAAERARPEATGLGRAIGLVPLDVRLVDIADTIAVAHRRPTPADLAFAQHAATAAPLDAVPYYIAAAAPARASAQQRALVTQALRRDPRLRPALAWRVADLAKTNDVAAMTRALIRLAILTPGSSTLWPALARASADPAARAVIKQQMAQGADWRGRYLSELSQSPVDRTVVFDMLQAGGKPSPAAPVAAPDKTEDRRAFIAVLVQRKEYERAYLAWVQWLPAQSQAAVGYVFDGTFSGVPALPPFAWQLVDGTGGATSIDPGSGLSLDYAGTDSMVVAQQTVMLPPGRYRLATQANFTAVSNDTGQPPLVWSISCLPDATPLGELAVPLVGAMQRAAGAPFEVAPGCAAQTLVLKVNFADFSRRLSGKVRSISVEAVQ